MFPRSRLLKGDEMEKEKKNKMNRPDSKSFDIID